MHRSPAAKLTLLSAGDVSIHQPRDPNTLSNYNSWRCRHVTANLEIDFSLKRVFGSVLLSLTKEHDAAEGKLVLDTSHVDVADVKIAGKKTKWDLASRIEPYGSPLTIELPSDHAGNLELDISFSTTKDCTALQWLTPAQTSNKKHPYMFSQCQAIHARSLFPCQDTPDVKSTFTFNIRSPLPVLASGLPTGSKDFKPPGKGNESGTLLYTFNQSIPIPSYLFALASGDLASASIGPRSAIWTGPEELVASQWELEGTEELIKAAEGIVYPYAWKTYNVLVLPPSFPYGGMENPQFTFATPTIISGDRENVDLIAHELAHSWSGNLVSNASWEHFWLNEGWTVYIQRRILFSMYSEAHRDFSAIIGWKALSDSIDGFGEDHEFTKLIVDLKGKDPDDAFSSVPYEKGATFLYHLEKLLGIDKWDKFIPHYFTVYKQKSVDSYEFKSTLLDFFSSDAAAAKKLQELDWDTWFYKPGYPPKPDFDTSMVDQCYALADKWQALNNTTDQADGDTGSGTASFQPAKSDIAGWSANQSVVFLERIQTHAKPLTAALVETMGSTYAYASSQNVELVSRFLVIGLAAHDERVYAPAAALLGRVGRMKFVRPLYRGLMACNERFARETFEKYKDFYHPICRGMVEKMFSGMLPRVDGG